MAPSDDKPARRRIGQMAVDKGYCTDQQVDEALRIQRKRARDGRPRQLTGIIMVQHGIISTGQLIDVLRAYEDEEE